MEIAGICNVYFYLKNPVTYNLQFGMGSVSVLGHCFLNQTTSLMLDYFCTYYGCIKIHIILGCMHKTVVTIFALKYSQEYFWHLLPFHDNQKTAFTQKISWTGVMILNVRSWQKLSALILNNPTYVSILYFFFKSRPLNRFVKVGDCSMFVILINFYTVGAHKPDSHVPMT